MESGLILACLITPTTVHKHRQVPVIFGRKTMHFKASFGCEGADVRTVLTTLNLLDLFVLDEPAFVPWVLVEH